MKLLCLCLPRCSPCKTGWALGVQAAYLERNRANELLLAKNYVNKMISARDPR